MKNCLLLLLATFILFSCHNNKKSGVADELNAASAKMVDKLLGSFVGPFGDNKITLLITKARNDTVEGRSIVGGNDRPFLGTIKIADGIYTIVAKEPGDDPNDGIFAFTVDPSDPNMLTGAWKPNDKTKQTKEYTLQRKNFVYNINVGDFPEASQRELKPADVEELAQSDLEWMRNEIFARHGYCFQRKQMREQFEALEWYVPDNVDVRNKLTEIERKNLVLIKRYEKYAEDYGDEYGR